MKNLLSALFLFLSYIGFSQGLNTELGFQVKYDQTVVGVVCVDEFSFLAIEQARPMDYITQLYKVDTLNQVIWDTNVTSLTNPYSPDVTAVKEMIPNANGGVYVLGFGSVICDVPGYNSFWFIKEYNASGQVKWLKLLEHRDYSVEMKGLTLDANNQVIVNYSSNAGSRILTIDSIGNIIDSLFIDKSYLQGLESLSGFDFVGFKNDSLYGFSSNTLLTNTIALQNEIKGIKTVNDTLYVLTSDSIHLFDHNLNKLLSNSVSGYSAFTNLNILNNKIEFLSHSAYSQTIITLNKQLQMIDLMTIPCKLDLETKKDYNSTHFSTAIDFDLSLLKMTRYRDYSRLSAQNIAVNSTDISIIDMQTNTIKINEIQGSPGLYYISFNSKVLIKNIGPNTLNSCHINYLISNWGICNKSVYIKYFDNLNLNSNDTMWLTLDPTSVSYALATNDSIISNICMSTSFANDLTDTIISNDEFCKNFTFGYVGIDNAPKQDAFSIFPNPTSDKVYLNPVPQQEVIYRIYSLQGSIIRSKPIHSGSIDISDLSSGMYILKITFSDGNPEIIKTISKK